MFYIKKQKGFTIVETMIVLGVTGVLFVSVSLLISGQTERYRYRDSMYRLQQQVQAQINDVQTGQFYKTATGGSSNDTVYLGKKVLFCAKGATNNACIGTKPNENQQKNVAVQYKDDVSKKTEEINEDIVPTPSNLNFIKSVKSNGDPFDSTQFGFSVLYNDPAIGGFNSSSLNVGIYNYNKLNKYDSTNYKILTEGYVLCFEGYKRGSLELGSKELGNTVKLNLVDSRCN